MNNKIVIDGRLISNKPTGISRYTKELIVSYQNKYGSENVFVICNSDKISGSFNIIHTRLAPFNLFHFVRFYFFLKKIDFDIYHSAFYAGTLRRIKNTLQIITVHDVMFYKVDSIFSRNKIINFFGKKYYELIVRITLRNADIIVSISESTANDVKSIFGFDSVVVGLGVSDLETNMSEIVDRDMGVLEKYGLQENEYFFYIGNNRLHKNLPFLIGAFRNSTTKYKLVLAGFEDKKLSVDESIVNISFVSDAELYILYKNCKAYIFPSLYEGFGLPIVEAIKNKCVVFSSNEGSLAEFKFKSIHFFNPRSKEELIELINHANEFVFHESDENLLLGYNWQKRFNVFQDYLATRRFELSKS